MAHSMRYAWRRIVVRDPGLSEATRRVLLELESYADPDGSNARPGVRNIAEQLHTAKGKYGHVSQRTVKTALATGLTRGFIELTEKAPRGRGNRRSDVYRLVIPTEMEATQTAPISADEKGATQTAPNTAEIGAITDVNRCNQTPLIGATQTAYHQITTYAAPDPLTPESSPLTFRIAHARDDKTGHEEDEPEVVDAEVIDEPDGTDTTDITSPITSSFERLTTRAPIQEPPQATTQFAPHPEPDPTKNPLAWIDRELPQGFLRGERARAEHLLAEGKSYPAARYVILRERRQPRANGKPEPA
ncbi:hypothetical protein [Antrihabitans stalactiti]|uniref:Helix-turn-helix domain-containing protein n=1 Tax=Antrihabitans stalactiti TaxID=2584121 RepID=A0A848KB26_9NOCA|nr:hypothetical protein [Antrihabitans stalactiti]NMN93902.1 hypothetical protein [Antrihabitans stalactiti]